MSNAPSTSHPERTATEPRQANLHQARICYIKQINPRVRLLRLALPYAVQFAAGQWLDVHVPALPNHTGGFTITSTPADASDHPRQDPLPPTWRNQKRISAPRPYFELAIAKSPNNPPAAWLWKDDEEILGKDVHVRVGGSFTWSPQGRRVKTAIFVAGGVGINPLVSMLSHLSQPEQMNELPETIRLLYSTGFGGGTLDRVLFLPRLRQIFQDLESRGNGSQSISLHFTNTGGRVPTKDVDDMNVSGQRITHEQLISALGPVASREKGIAAYVCGPPAMTDEFVEVLERQEGMKNNVFREKWW